MNNELEIRDKITCVIAWKPEPLHEFFPISGFNLKIYGCKTKRKALLYYPLRFGKIFWLIRK
jgi:hypothetical protein